jgi:hypothetical protein
MSLNHDSGKMRDKREGSTSDNNWKLEIITTILLVRTVNAITSCIEK